MEGPSTPKHQRVSSIQLESDLRRTPSYPTSHYSSSTNIADAKANLKTILATRVSFNDPNIVDVLVKPDEVSAPLVKALRGQIMANKEIKGFLAGVRQGKIKLESEMYEPLRKLLNTIIGYEENASKDEKHTHNKEEGEKKDDNGDHSTSKPTPANDTNFAQSIRRAWLDVHSLIPRTDSGLFIPGMHMDCNEDIMLGQKRTHGDVEVDADTPGPSKARRSSMKQQFARESDNKGKTDAFDKRRPDLVLVDYSTPKARQDACLWRHIAVLLEVKRLRESRPNPADGRTLTGLAAQLADMARLHLAARPFMRFSVHLTVCGVTFNLAIFDRAGGVVSKDYNINKNLDTFIRIVRRLGRDLNAYDLGLDRTVVPLHTLGSWKQFPEFRVKVGGSAYITQGLPLWQSSSLVGRGTFVWVAVLEVDGEESGKGSVKTFILKNAWRAHARLAESTVYKMLSSATTESTSSLTNLDGVAQFIEGGDVYDPDQPNEVVKVSSHRKGFGKPIDENDDPVLHRLVLASHGRKLYEFETFPQLMLAAKKMSSGLRALHDRGITHGDISLGNLFLGTTEDIPGFVGDLDLAKVDLETIKQLFPGFYDEVASSKRGALRTGTSLFMSIRLLKALTNHYELVELAATDPAVDIPSELDFVPGPGDDLESMIWVLTYAIMLRHHGNLQGPHKAFYKSHFVDAFYGCLSYSALAEKRQMLMLRGINLLTDELKHCIPDLAQRKWIRGAMTLVAGQNLLFPGSSITSITFDAFDKLCDDFLMKE